MNLTPRKDFRESPLAKGWGDVVTSPQFEAAAKAAMIELQNTLMTGALTPENAEAAAYRLNGAKMFLGELMSLTETEAKSAVKQTGLTYAT